MSDPITTTTPADPPEDDETAVGSGGAPRPSSNGHGHDPASIVGGLAARRDTILEEQFLTLRIPRWTDPEIFVRYRPVPYDDISRGQRALQRAKRNRSEAEMIANIDLLVRSCEAVFARLDGTEYSLRPNDPGGELTQFDRDLAVNLGLDEGATARQVVRSIFLTDGDILAQAQSLMEWSGYRTEEVDEELSGE